MKRFTTFFVLMAVLCLSAVISASTTISANSETSESVLCSERTYDVSVVKIKRMSNGMLVKRPILVGDDIVLTGFKEDIWKEVIING